MWYFYHNLFVIFIGVILCLIVEKYLFFFRYEKEYDLSKIILLLKYIRSNFLPLNTERLRTFLLYLVSLRTSVKLTIYPGLEIVM